MWPPENSTSVRLYPSLTVGRRSSQLDLSGLRSESATAPHAENARCELAAAVAEADLRDVRELKPQFFVLGPGDALYLPPYWLHHVCVTRDAPAMSLSIWARSTAQRATTQLIQLQLPLAAHWDTGERLTVSVV